MNTIGFKRAALATALTVCFSAPAFAGGDKHMRSNEGSTASTAAAASSYGDTPSRQSEETTRIEERRMDGQLAPNTTSSDVPRAATAAAPQTSPSAGYQGSNTAAASGTSAARGASIDSQLSSGTTRLDPNDAEHQPTLGNANLDAYGPALTGAENQFGNFGEGSSRAD